MPTFCQFLDYLVQAAGIVEHELFPFSYLVFSIGIGVIANAYLALCIALGTHVNDRLHNLGSSPIGNDHPGIRDKYRFIQILDTIITGI